jgi:hypothetical protein
MPLHEKPWKSPVYALTVQRGRPRPVVVSLLATFAALNVVADLLPLTPVIGVNGAFFRLSWVVAPLTGLLLGPLWGGGSCVLAGLTELCFGLQSTQPFGVFTPVRMGLSAMQAGLVVKGRWKTAVTILGSLIGVWVLLPTGREALLTVSLHGVGCVLLLAFRTQIRGYVTSTSWKQVALGVAVATYSGNVSRHLLGNLLLVILTDAPSTIFVAALPFTIVEQAAFLAAAIILGTALTRTRARAVLEVYGESKAF